MIRLAIIRCNQYSINIRAFTHPPLRTRISVGFYRRVTLIVLASRRDVITMIHSRNLRLERTDREEARRSCVSKESNARNDVVVRFPFA